HQLQPHLAMRALLRQGSGDPPPDHLTAAYLCCLCNVCESYACTLDRSPRAIFQELQAQLRADGVQNPHQRAECQPDDFQKDRRVPLPRLIAKLGLTDYVKAPDVVALGERAVSQVKLRLSQHTGAPAVPVVSVGQAVTRGQLVAEIPEGKLGARIHASITGRVSAVDDREIQINES
ncbi:MAG: electron transport complex protein RnfC, partial [Deltaproteobacteria bacterium]|nr:electron transport complex protein RnfC [Deltaproteobacteria bacterium]